MSHTVPTSMTCNLGGGVTVERNIATALWNQHERERIIAWKAHEVFRSRGCEHGFDLNDWLTAEQELSSAEDEVLLTQSPEGLDISIAERAGQADMLLSISPSSLLIVWAGGEADAGEQNTHINHSTLKLVALPETADPEKAKVTFCEGRVWLNLPYAATEHFASGPSPVEPN
jgi:Protein of unknown function (DUF2934)